MEEGGSVAGTDGAVPRLDLRGLKCPLPALKTARHLAALAPGRLVEILADDPLAGLDLPLLFRQEGHRIVEQDHDAERGHRFLVERRV